jgi:hypothetical protein
VGIAYGHAGYGLLFKKGKIVKRLKYDELEVALLEEAQGIASGEARIEEPDSAGPSNGAAVHPTHGMHPLAEEILANTRF